MRKGFLTVFLFLGILNLSAMDIYVSHKGGTKNSGTKSDPVSFKTAIERVSKILKTKGLPKDGVTIHVLGGVYRFHSKFVLGEEFQGTKEKPIIIKAVPGEKVLFDGSILISPKSFSCVTNSTEKERLAKSAVEEVQVATIKDSKLIAKFNKNLMLNLSYDGVEYLPSVFPNEGTANFNEVPVKEEMTPPGIPIGKQNYGVRGGYVPYREEGKPRGWKGTIEEPRGASASFSEKGDEMAGTWTQWEKELERNRGRNQLTGFIEANWLLSSQKIYSADSNTKSIRLSRALGYGWAWRKKDKPFRVFGLLCELDKPGEWHFDPLTNRLYVYPVKKLSRKTKIAISLADGFISLENTKNVHLIGLSVKNVGDGNVYELTGDSNIVASAAITNCTATGIVISGTNNKLLGSELRDLNFHAKLTGGIKSPTEITPGNNLIENCHIYQKDFKHEKVNIHMTGVGNKFRHNLIHNSLGQAMIVNGNDQLVEFNELFNIGFEEGDGGAIYSGNDLAGFGNIYRYNFFHHLMHTPGKVERAGLHLDDGQSGATCVGNIFYKSASKGIFMFGGAGHTLSENVFLEGDRGAYYVKVLAKGTYDLDKAIRKTPNHHKIGTKEDYLGRVEKFTGINGWQKSPWKEKYPLMNLILSDTAVYGRFWPICYTVTNNFYFGNKKSSNQIIDYRVEKEVIAKSLVKYNQDLESSDVFVDYENMNFKFKDTSKYPNIPFGKIGLKLDAYRSSMPDKQKYRKEVKKFFKGIVSGAPGTSKRIDTSKLVD